MCQMSCGTKGYSATTLLVIAICAVTLPQCCDAIANNQYFITSPTNTTVCQGSTATFFCASQTGAVTFIVNGSIFLPKNITATVTQGSATFNGILTVLGTKEYDNLTIACNILMANGASVTSEVSVLRVQGPPSSVSNVMYDAISTTLSWTSPPDALNLSLLSYQVIVTNQTSGYTLISIITKETRVALPLPELCASSYIIQVLSTCEALIGTSSQLTYHQSIPISNLAAFPGIPNSVALSWASPPGLRLNYSIVVTRDDGYIEGNFVTEATALTVPISQPQLCRQYHIAVAAICVSKMRGLSLGPANILNISLGTPPTVHGLQYNVNGTLLHVRWEVLLNYSDFMYYVEVTELDGTNIYSVMTLETALTIPLPNVTSHHYSLTVMPLCGTIKGSAANIDVIIEQLVKKTEETTANVSPQLYGIAVGTTIGVIVILVVAVACAVIAYKQCKGGQSESDLEPPVRFFWGIQRLLLPNKKLGPNTDVVYQDVIRGDIRMCEEQGKMKKTVSERQHLSRSNLYTETERKNLPGHDTVDGGVILSTPASQEQNPYADISEIRHKCVLVPSEQHYSTPRVHYDVPKVCRTSAL